MASASDPEGTLIPFDESPSPSCLSSTLIEESQASMRLSADSLKQPARRAMGADDSATTSFRIVRLPRELHDVIWRYALVRPKIHIAFSSTSKFPDKGPVVKRRIKLIVRNEIVRPSTQMEGSYHRWLPALESESGIDMVNHNLFVTSRWVNEDCTKIFYAENLFAFGGDCSQSRGSGVLASIYAFLKDRNPTVKKSIRHVEITSFEWRAGYKFCGDEYDYMSASRAIAELNLDTLSLNVNISLVAFFGGWWHFVSVDDLQEIRVDCHNETRARPLKESIV
ncbi:unnamed protein product [Discula destructiva]